MSMKAVCFVAALCVFATLTVQASEVTAKGIDVKKAVDAGWTPAPVAEFAQLRWASEKEKFNKNHANQLVPFGAYRTVYVANLLRKIVKDMGIHGEEIMVNAMGSTNPTSDYDVTIDHHRADELATRFNSEFEGAWGETSADVFDTNIYPVGWVLDKRAWQNRVPFCTHPLADTAKHASGSNDVTVRGYEEFKPAAEFTTMRKKFENATVIWGLVKAQYQINVLGADMFKDHVAGVSCHAKQAPVVSRGMCMLMHYFRTTALNNINWRNVGAPVEAADAGAGSLLSTPLYHRGKTIIGEIMTSSVQKLHTLMTTPCSEDPAFNRTCCYSYYSSDRKKYESAIHMNNMKCRNRMYEKWAKKVYDKLRTAGRCTFDAWFDLVEDIRVAEFYGAETYYTEGAFFKTVLAEQALVPSLLKDNPALERFKGLKITRLEIVSSVLENFADFVKELGHSVHEHWNQTETVVQASKYMKRLLTASRDLIDTSPGADAAGTALHEELANILKKSSKPTEDLAGKIRGKAMTPELIAIRDQNVQILEAVYNDLAGNYRAVINSKNPERTHIPSWYRASMALTARMLDYFIIVNESNPAYHASYVMYDGTQHNGPAHSSSSSSSSSSAKAPAAAASPSAPAAKKRAARFAHKRLQPHF